MTMIRMSSRSWTGAEWDGALLWLRGPEMRVVVSGYGMPMEFRRHGGQWFAENGGPVQMNIHSMAPT